jgi:crossover junction endodeoxyribonuclease RuvC
VSFVLGLDPGFSCVGFALVRLDGDELHPTEMGVIRTEKASKKQNVFASEDNLRRAREITAVLNKILRAHPVQAMCAETMSFPRSSSVAAKMAMCWGVVAAFSELMNIPLVQATPKALKKSVTGRADASKEDIIEVLRKRYGEEVEGLVDGVPPSLREHPYDALGAVVACRDSELLRLLRRQGEARTG